ncbi:MAG: helix-turn-helix domain-containing protein [Microbacterium sp.]|uniref:TetR/AcrR family transcriptional regulator n=1 Tax=Microbacterium sp. TaxID=51671 RepID=UPI0039E7285F
MVRRGSYAKGVAKRQEILRAALDVVAREGYRGASVRQIADAVGLSQAGLLHYFDSKEELFTEILRTRDQVDQAAFEPPPSTSPSIARLIDGYLRTVRHNAEVPGLVQLFSRLAVDGADPQHPAHRYFVERGTALRSASGEVVAQAQREGIVTDAVPAETICRMLQAISDGMQLQWMLEPETDMAEVVRALFLVLAPGAVDAGEAGDAAS